MKYIPLLLVALFSLAWNGAFAYVVARLGHPLVATLIALVFAWCMVRWLRACHRALR